ncbi:MULTISPECIES: hypothetical protein [Streptomyces]|uniref:hypothetical protein n=1 Tax=Streptomyces TaxID=1883 RepID=UPI00073DC093|nr:hypothetical protein [Streptomyces sp. EAS-AB2608]MYU29626.1 hypothetical protein [Streptomyces sp. SID7810]BCM69058.1 hypothetical protein EASAB2608_04392 [Streptomyces sp. EAS-AB2608]CUW30688.1 hypothetical protein TUE45_05422 [Streptomyces reticuli]
MSPRAGQAGHPARTLAFVESPVQLLNVLEWAHLHGLRDGAGPTHRTATPPTATPPTATDPTATPRTAPGAADRSGPAEPPGPAGAQLTGGPSTGSSAASGPSTGSSAASGPSAGFSAASGPAGGPSADAELTVVVLSPTDPMTRGQLRRMADLARDEGHRVRWEEARGGTTAPFHTIGGLAGPLRRADRIVMGDPFSRYVQLLLTITRAHDLVVVDDGTATMEFVAQLARGERLVRWHRKGGRPGPRDLLFAPVSSSARRRLTPSDRRRVEVFSSMPVTEIPDGVTVTANDFAWTRARFGPPRITQSADLVGTSLVETGVVDGDRYLEAVRNLAKAHGATRYFAHRRESTEKLHRLAVETGLEIVRPDLPLELIARRGPIGRTILSFPSTVVHTLPLALAGTGVRVAVCDIDPTWLTDTASPRAQGFLSGVTGTARDVHRLAAVSLA